MQHSCNKKHAKFNESQRIVHHGISGKTSKSKKKFFLLLKLNTSNNVDLNYSKYLGFNLENISEDDCIAEFHVRKSDKKRLQRALNLPNEIFCYPYHDLNVDATEALCILITRLA